MALRNQEDQVLDFSDSGAGCSGTNDWGNCEKDGTKGKAADLGLTVCDASVGLSPDSLNSFVAKFTVKGIY